MCGDGKKDLKTLVVNITNYAGSAIYDGDEAKTRVQKLHGRPLKNEEAVNAA